MSFDGMVTGAVARQLNTKLKGGKIEKIYQPEADEIIIYIHSGKENYKLYMSANSSHARIHLITEKDSNPQNPMGFCMLLRKHLQGGHINEIIQKDSERIIEISIDTINELGFSVNKKLIMEIMGKHSNIVVIDAASNKIIDSIKRISIDVNRYRQLLPGQQYLYPPSQNKISYYKLTENQLNNLISKTSYDLSRCLLNSIQGISPIIAEEIVNQAKLNSSQLDKDPPLSEVYNTIYNMVQKIRSGNLNPKVYIDENNIPKDFHIFNLSSMAELYKELTFTDISEAISYYYLNKNSSNRIKQKSSDLHRTVTASLNKLYLKKQRLSEDLLKAEESQIYKLYGELLTANLHLIKDSIDSITVFNYYDNTNVKINLNTRLSPSQNAQNYYKKYNKAKTAITEKNIQLNETNKDISYLDSIVCFLENANTIEEIEEVRQELIEGGYLRKRKNNYKPAKSKSLPYSYMTKDGFKILVGRNNKENDILTFKTADRKDIWFHTKDIPGSHVILFTEGKSISDNSILEAASLAAYHSKGRNSENVPVDYTKVKYVKKPSGAKPGMVIFTNNKTIYVNPKDAK
ncbi:Rqc2 family fibronectin-binding protein [Anaerovorax odorimutans]|uniref:Rqc2 family fibronectin-binding protein n=1 Tax=Anaerovorax odorimutans TaxID=109327 RepID=UPI000415127D|nr:NFACT RNA binding domain-containing protein [Anaerovorax odorimutans]